MTVGAKKKINKKSGVARTSRKASPATHTPRGWTTQDGPTHTRDAAEFCVVTCVVTLASLPVSRDFAPCRSGTGEGQGTAAKVA